MINYIDQDSKLKSYIVKVVLVFVVTILATNIVYAYELNKVYKNQLDTTREIVGSLVNKYPEKEMEIIKAIKYTNEKNRKEGKEILDSYGYKHDGVFNENSKEIIVKSTIVAFIICILGILTIFMVTNKFFLKISNQVEEISSYISNFLEEDFYISEDFEGEGIFKGLLYRLKDLSNNLKIQLYKLNNEKENLKSLVTDISHQLKTPLASLNLYNSILIKEDLNDKERYNFLTSNEEVITKLHNLIDSLVNISRLESNMININPAESLIKNTIIKAINSVYMKAMDKDIEITLDEFEDVCVYHDKKWTEEAIFNVLDNAVKYTDKSGEINIEIWQTLNYIQLDIKDSGKGLKQVEVNDIFKRFYRGADTENIEGSGVGLYLSRKILESQGGSIIAKSNDDKGSTFSLLLQKCNN